MVYVCKFGVVSATVWMAWLVLGMPGWVFLGVAVVGVGVVGTLFV